MINISELLEKQGVDMFVAWDIEIAFRKKYGDSLRILANDEGWILDHVADVMNFDVIKKTWNDSEYGEMPAWIEPIGEVDHIERNDYTGWKQHEWRGKFQYDGKSVYGTLINHFHVDRQEWGDAIENVFWSEA